MIEIEPYRALWKREEQDNKELREIIEYKEQKIERLNKALDTATEIINNKHKEIVILNNIINELEKELENMATLKTDKYGNTRKITHIDINWLLTKIKELKRSDEE